MATVKADFLADVTSYAISELQKFGIQYQPKDATDALLTLQNVWKRRIDQRPRKVASSKELLSRVLAPDIRVALDHLTSVIEKGNDLTPYLSRRVELAAYNDMLMHDWGIHHLHLRIPGAGPDGLTPRRKELVFARVTPDTIYLLDVLDHDEFANDELLEIIQANWPALIAPYKVTGLGLDSTLTKEERVNMRKAGVLVVTGLRDGSVLMPPGGGYSTAGTSISDLTTADRLTTTVRTVQEKCEQNADKLSAMVAARTGKQQSEVVLKLNATSAGVDFIEESTGARVLLDGNFNPIALAG